MEIKEKLPELTFRLRTLGNSLSNGRMNVW